MNSDPALIDNFVVQRYVEFSDFSVLGAIIDIDPTPAPKPPETPISCELEAFEIKVIDDCGCLSWSKQYFSHLRNIKVYNSKNLWENAEKYKLTKSEIPICGAMIITTDSTIYWHSAIVQKIDDDELTLYEKNIEGCWVSKRILKISDPRIIGYLY